MMKYAAATAAGLALIILGGCNGGVNDVAGVVPVELPVPARIRQVSAVDPAQLSLQLTVNNQTYPAVRQPNGSYISRVSVPANTDSRITVVWIENYEGVSLRLAERSLVVPVGNTDDTIFIADSYTTTGAGFDNDGDGISNLTERIENSNPIAADEGPDDALLRLNVSVPEDVVLLGDAVVLNATLNGEAVSLQGVTADSATATVTGLSAGEQVNASVQIGSSGLTLASAQRSTVLQAGDNNQLTISQSDFDVSADVDNDGLSNIKELLRGTDPRSFADIRINRTDSPPLIDGSLQEAVWRSRLESNNSRRINRLIVADSGQDQVTLDGLLSTWAAVTDGETLFMAFRIIDGSIWFDSGETWWKDDSIEIFIDGDNSKQTGGYDGDDDYHFAFRVGDRQVIKGGRSVALPDDLFYELSSVDFNVDIIAGAFGSDLNGDGVTDTGFNLEIAVPLDELEISIDEPFGINVHYNDDDNSGNRDAKYTWTGQFGVDIDFLEPSALGTAVIGN